MSGLYDGDFVGFRTGTSAEIDAALGQAIVAIDANVLLNLYRFRPQTSRDLIKVLERLDDRLVVPHQALREFWRHRQRSPASPQAATTTAVDAFEKSSRSLSQALETWAKQVGLDGVELASLTDRVTTFVDAMKQDLAAAHADVGNRAPTADTILAELELVLEGRVTDPLPAEEWEKCIIEAQRRIEAEEPPGYKDAAKEQGDSPEGGAGDYLVWDQATRYAASADRDLVIITADEKEDWWWRHMSSFIGPRPELAFEYHQLCGRRLFLLGPSDLLARASTLQVEVDADSAADATRPAQDEVPESAWTIEALDALLDRLDSEAPVQAAALRIAVSTDSGIVSRERVYELGGCPDDRMLRGFTRPYRRLTEVLQDEGLLPRGLPPILVARYPDGVKASFFSVPPNVPAIFRGQGADSESQERQTSDG